MSRAGAVTRVVCGSGDCLSRREAGWGAPGRGAVVKFLLGQELELAQLGFLILQQRLSRRLLVLQVANRL
jgi:hypothetical protein